MTKIQIEKRVETTTVKRACMTKGDDPCQFIQFRIGTGTGGSAGSLGVWFCNVDYCNSAVAVAVHGTAVVLVAVFFLMLSFK